MLSLTTIAFLAPLLIVIVPLLFGRYPGESAILAAGRRRGRIADARRAGGMRHVHA